MVDFVRMAATAQRLIQANGREVTLVKQDNVSADVDKPWRGRDWYAKTKVTGRAAFVPLDFRGLGIEVVRPDEIARPEQIAFFAAADDEGEPLDTFDLLIDGEVEWQIVRAHLLQPAEPRIMYVFEVRR